MGCIGFSHSPTLRAVHIMVVVIDDISVPGVSSVPGQVLTRGLRYFTFWLVGGWPGLHSFSLRVRLLFSLPPSWLSGPVSDDVEAA